MTAIIICVMLFLLIVLLFIRAQKKEQNRFHITKYTFPMCSIEDMRGMKYVGRFVVLSDLHNHVFGNDNDTLFEAVVREKPDFIVIAGDMLTAVPGKSMKPGMEFVLKLAKHFPIYYGNGNHEYRLRLYPEKYGKMYEQFKQYMQQDNIYHLENKTEELTLNGRKIHITGLEINRKYYRRFKKITMEDDYLIKEIGLKPDGYSILIAHNPDYFDKYALWGTNLVLSGHVHGGIVRLPGIGGVVSPRMRLFPRYSGGVYKNGISRMIVSRGLGTHTIPVRIRNRAELIVVNLADKGE